MGFFDNFKSKETPEEFKKRRMSKSVKIKSGISSFAKTAKEFKSEASQNIANIKAKREQKAETKRLKQIQKLKKREEVLSQKAKVKALENRLERMRKKRFTTLRRIGKRAYKEVF